MRGVFGWLLILFSACWLGCQAMAPQGAVPMGREMGAAGDVEMGDGPDAANDTVTSSDGGQGADAADAAVANPSALPIAIKPPQYADAGISKTQPGGVSALPADVGGGEDAKTPFRFTLSATLQPLCLEAESSATMLSLVPKIRYRLSGKIGAVLMDGTPVPLSYCEMLTFRLQAGAGGAARCQDAHVFADCHLSDTVVFRKGVQPDPYIFLDYSQGADPDFHECGDMDNMGLWGPTDLSYLSAEAEKLPTCSSLTIDRSFLPDANVMKKLPMP